MFHCKKVNSKINHIHQRALCIVYKINVLSFEELLQLVELFKIHHKNVQLHHLLLTGVDKFLSMRPTFSGA